LQLFHNVVSVGTSSALLSTSELHQALPRLKCDVADVVNINRNIDQSLCHQQKGTVERLEVAKNKVKCFCPAEEDDETFDVVEGRREASFAMMGTLWAIFLDVVLGGYHCHFTWSCRLDVKMIFPDIVQEISDRKTKQG